MKDYEVAIRRDLGEGKVDIEKITVKASSHQMAKRKGDAKAPPNGVVLSTQVLQ